MIGQLVLAVAEDQGLENPYHDGEFSHTWFHGTNKDIDTLDSSQHPHERPGAGHGGPQTNKLLGTHFSSLHSVSREFVKDHADSTMFHSKLDIKNPAHFPTEGHLDRAIFRHAMTNPAIRDDDKYNEDLQWQGASTSHQLMDSDLKRPDGSLGRRSLDGAMARFVQMHPKQHEIAKSFVDHLHAQGHDGITYGNEVEGPRFHTSAIATKPSSIKIIKKISYPAVRTFSNETPMTEQETAENTAQRAENDKANESNEFLTAVQKHHTGSEGRYDGSETNLGTSAFPEYTEPHPEAAPEHRVAAMAPDVRKPLPIGDGIAYRLHYTPRKWDTGGGATSSPFHSTSNGERPNWEHEEGVSGYSAFADPHDLDDYMNRNGLTDRAYQEPNKHRIVQFTAQPKAKGFDGETTYMPGARADRVEHTMDEFQQRLDKTPQYWKQGHTPEQSRKREHIMDHLIGGGKREDVEPEISQYRKQFPGDQHLDSDMEDTNDPAYDYAKTAGAAGPDYDNLSFVHEKESGTYGAHTLRAVHPDHGPVGFVEYDEQTWPRGPIRRSLKVNSLDVSPEHQRRGVASQLMTALEKRHPGIVIDHGDRTEQGRDWAKAKYGDDSTREPEDPAMYRGHLTRNGEPFDLNTRASKTAAEDDDYRMQHRPADEDGIPIHDMTSNLPADIYTHPHYYSDMSEPGNREAHSVINRVRGNPEAKVHIYRALPAEHASGGIRQGDWVSTSKDYAREHGKHPTDPKKDWPVIHSVVQAKHLFTQGDDFREYGYTGPDKAHAGVAYRGGPDQEVRQHADGVVRQVTRKPKPAPYAGPSQGYTFSHEGYGVGPFQHHLTTAYDPNGNYAGHVKSNGGQVAEHEVLPEHAHTDIGDRLLAEHGSNKKWASKTAALNERDLTWDEIGERHPDIYGDPEVYGEEARHGDGQGIGWAANHLAHSRAEDPDAEGSGAYDLRFDKKRVPVSQIDYGPSEAGDSRVQHARRGYASGAAVPPPVLVHRHGVYQVADGHHRAQGAAEAGLSHIDAYVAQSPHEDEPFGDGRKAPFYGAQAKTAGQAGRDYDDLNFRLRPARDDFHNRDYVLEAHHFDHGLVGSVSYRPHQHPGGQYDQSLTLTDLGVPPEHQRRGVATSLIKELERRHPGVPINQGDHTSDGADWVDSVYGGDSGLHRGGWTVDGEPMARTAAVDYDLSHPDNVGTDWASHTEELPSHHGFHCDGECSEESGVGEMNLKSQLGEVGTHPILHPLHPLQDYLNKPVLDHYRNGGGPDRYSGDDPAIVTHKGKHYVYQGTHRLAVAMARGDKTYTGHYLNLDQKTSVRKPVRRDPATGIEMCPKKVDGFPCKYLLGHTQDHAVDWNAAYDDEPEEPTPKTSATRDVRGEDSEAGAEDGIMIAVVPPKALAKKISIEGGEGPDQMHITLAYLGKTGEYEKAHLDGLLQCVKDWAKGQVPMTATVQGAGTFVAATEDAQHVLWASVDAPGLERAHVSLVDHLEAAGYNPSRDHVFVPHMTLSYEPYHVRFLPKIERESWEITTVWVCVGGRWESVRVTG